MRTYQTLTAKDKPKQREIYRSLAGSWLLGTVLGAVLTTWVPPSANWFWEKFSVVSTQAFVTKIKGAAEYRWRTHEEEEEGSHKLTDNSGEVSP